MGVAGSSSCNAKIVREDTTERFMKLRCENLVKKYGVRTVVKGVSMEVEQGEIVGFLGPNGAGKTTSFYMITGLIVPNAGRIFLDDEEITGLPMYKRAQKGVGYLAQEASVFRRMSVEDNILSNLLLTSDIRALFAQEFAVAREGGRMIEQQTGVHFSDDELGYIALHVHSSLESMQVSQAMQTAAIIRECVDLVQQETGVVIDVSSLSYNRLMSHIKYMAARLIKGEKLSMDVNTIIDKYLELQKRESEQRDEITYRSAEAYNLQQPVEGKDYYKDDVLVIDQNLKGLDFTLARCCNPIYGDEVFGFVSISGGIKIHRCDCPNAKDMKSRFPYRIVRAKWAGKSQGKQYPITLRIVGHDDIGIVTNITSIINKESDILLRSISIDSHDGLFSGMLTVMVDDTGKLEALIKKIKTVKGVKQVNRG